jgi:organic radical activating enzyme
MRVFIYHNLIDHPIFRSHNEALARANRLTQHLEYLHETYAYFKNFETTNPEEADFFFVPLFMAGWQFANHDPHEFIALCTHLSRGRHILLATGDFGQRAESIHEMKQKGRAYEKKYKWLDSRFTLLALESTRLLYAQDVAILPYPTRDIAPPPRQRDIFLSFMGVMSYPQLPPSHIRGGRLAEIRALVDAGRQGSIVIGSPEQVASVLGQPTSPDEIMARSVFTLCAAGYGRWSFRFNEALLNGSIPVLLADDYVLPFADGIDWNQYCIVVPENQADGIVRILDNIPAARVHELQRNIARDAALFGRAGTQAQLTRVLEKMAASGMQDPLEEILARDAIGRMRSPHEMHIICVDVTNKCDLACSNCTRLLENQDKFWEMSPENFRTALRSLREYPGMIAMIGGNPCMHTKFEELCRIFQEEIPNRAQRGLWTNNIFKHAEIAKETFGGFNLNPHNNTRALPTLSKLYEETVVTGGRSGGYYPGNSEHAPVLTACQDVIPDRAQMWNAISNCDVNRDWSATVIQNQGELRIYFCEIAASFDLARNQDHGHPLFDGWWRQSIAAFSGQVKKFCPGCGVPARLKGVMDRDDTDVYSETNADIALKAQAKKKRKVIAIDTVESHGLGHRVTKYSANAA